MWRGFGRGNEVILLDPSNGPVEKGKGLGEGDAVAGGSGFGDDVADEERGEGQFGNFGEVYGGIGEGLVRVFAVVIFDERVEFVCE